jgi:phosphohistidine phosphatase
MTDTLGGIPDVPSPEIFDIVGSATHHAEGVALIDRCPMSERRLILLRHAKSDWSGGEPDVARPLASRGRRQAPEAGRWLAAHAEGIDLAVVSPAVRASSTWALASAELDVAPSMRVDDRVYGASDRGLLTVVRDLPDDAHTVVLVGHNPGLEDLAALLTGDLTPMPTSALAVITVSGSWSAAHPGSAVLVTAGRPPVA